jgi:hypothetical protein
MRALWYDLDMSTPSAAPLRQPLARTKNSWLALGVFSLLAVLLSWPVIATLSSRIPGTATGVDESTFA